MSEHPLCADVLQRLKSKQRATGVKIGKHALPSKTVGQYVHLPFTAIICVCQHSRNVVASG
ncbi:hypothetical protein GPLA_0183 [Paraglaciecola polaris LMG 21857]|uniref:Uncharacterized protein n=1 Tax=Paraglaciecola polaris LMG 21857 TaxID=1129793 RepID=K6ZL91_9ALTE|nr:hypothetical protein GPLA_0183 [Paraglaciecola polaris LMG 21857]